MPSSLALVAFEDAAEMAEELMALEGQYKDPPTLTTEKKVRGLRGAAAVLMVAAFEAFLKKVVVERLSPLAVDPPPVHFDHLPDDLRISSVFSSLEAAMKGPRHGQAMSRANRLTHIKRAASLVSRGLIDPSALCDTAANPGPATVKRILKDLGISDPFSKWRPVFLHHWTKPEAETFLADKLGEIVDRRHRVAHTADALSIGRIDLRSSLDFLLCLARAVDEVLEGHLAGLSRASSRQVST